jgi:competence protein ComEC
MNVSLVGGALVSILARYLRRQLVLLISICGVIFYAFLAGFEPSIVRATIMVVISMIAGLLGRPYYGLISLLLTGYMMLFFRPLFVADVGFQLSFLSTLGILLIGPILPIKNNILADDIKTTLSAQLMTLPVLLGTFGQYGLLSIPVNALVLWTIPFLMVFGALGAISGLLFRPAGEILVWLCIPFLFYFERVVEFFAQIEMVWILEDIPWQIYVGYYLIVLGWITYRFKKR